MRLNAAVSPRNRRNPALTLSHLILAIVIVSALLFGSVEPWSLAMVGISTAVAFSVFILRWDGFVGHPFAKHFLAMGTMLLGYGLIQLIPMPLAWLSTVHPALSQVVSMPGAATDPVTSGQTLTILESLPSFHSVSIYPCATEMELARLAICFMIFFIVAVGPHTHEEIHSVVRMLAIFGFLLALFAVTQKATWNGKLYWFRELSLNKANPFGPFVNRNHFAGWMCMVAPLSFGVGLMSRSASRRIRYIFFAIVMAIAIFFSLSRGGVVSFLTGAMALIAITGCSASSRKTLVPICASIVFLFIYLTYIGLTPIMERFAQAGMSSHERISVWSASLTAFRDFPLFGTGLGTFQHIFSMYKPDGIIMFYQHAHNDYIEILIETGIVGALIVLLFLALLGKSILNVSWRGRERHLKAAFAASFISIAIFSLFDFNLHIPSNAILFSFIAGLAVAMSRLEQKAERRRYICSIQST